MIIDIHTHYLAPNCLAAAAVRRLPPMPREMYDPGARLAAMDAQGVDLQVVCPPPSLFLYEAEPLETALSCRHLNDGTAELCRRHPHRFAGLGAIPLQDVNLAVAELTRCREQLGLAGVVVGTHAGSRYLDHPDLRPVLEAAAALGSFVLVHPLSPPGVEALREHYMVNTVGNPLDTTVCITRLIHSGVMDQLPHLRFCFAHGGGYAVYGAGRLDHAWRVRDDLRAAARQAPGECLRRFWFDSCTYSARAVEFLVDAVGADRVLLGSDAPQDMADPEPLRRLEQAVGLSPGDRLRIAGANAASLLGLPNA